MGSVLPRATQSRRTAACMHECATRLTVQYMPDRSPLSLPPGSTVDRATERTSIAAACICMHAFKPCNAKCQGGRGEMAASKAFFSGWSSACRLCCRSIVDDDVRIPNHSSSPLCLTADGAGARRIRPIIPRRAGRPYAARRALV
jgi:hypothetical protein